MASARTFQEVSINSLLDVKGCPKTTCWKVLVLGNFEDFSGMLFLCQTAAWQLRSPISSAHEWNKQMGSYLGLTFRFIESVGNGGASPL